MNALLFPSVHSEVLYIYSTIASRRTYLKGKFECRAFVPEIGNLIILILSAFRRPD